MNKKKRCDHNQPLSIGSGQACIFSIFWAFFFPFSCSFCTLLLCTVTPSELNAHWKDNGMSSGWEWPLHLLLLWQHVGKLKQEDREEEQSEQKSKDKRKGGVIEGGKDAKGVCMCVSVVWVSSCHWAQGLLSQWEDSNRRGQKRGPRLKVSSVF